MHHKITSIKEGSASKKYQKMLKNYNSYTIDNCKPSSNQEWELLNLAIDLFQNFIKLI
jgi:hypothetical protein